MIDFRKFKNIKLLCERQIFYNNFVTRFTKQLKTYDLIPSPHDSQSELQNLSYLPPSVIPLHDREVIIFRRPESPYWTCRFKRHFLVAQLYMQTLSYVFQLAEHVKGN